ncbi:MAG: class I SAM-dependent methyltransferase [Bacteroidales bacterium]|nr:class I SAM-dependent methyltransferase [Bacteroidales bacterium]
MNYYRIARAFKYFAFSRHRKGHGIHSPFVFDFINTVLRKDIPPEVMDIILKIRKYMAGSCELIKVNDLGAGSQYTKSSRRRLSDISRTSAIRNRYGRVLHNIAQQYDGKNILELGTSVGISTIFMAMGAPFSKIISIEGCNNLAKVAKRNIARGNIGNTDIIQGDFDTQLHAIRATGFRPSMVFVDGNHRKEPVLRYFTLLKELITDESVIIFDDINYSFEMNEAWNEIKSDLQVSVSIDIFQMGFVFFREGMVKQDFVIRY